VLVSLSGTPRRPEIGPERRKRNHIRQLEALGYTVTLTEVA
jgi:hypothetical protein